MMTSVSVFQVTKPALGLQIKENLGQIKEPGKSASIHNCKVHNQISSVISKGLIFSLFY